VDTPSPVAGVDEVGRGCLAGPVVAAAVIFSPGRIVPGLRDSKQLSPIARERLYAAISVTALAVSWGMADSEEIDAINILQASRLAMVRAVSQLSVEPALLRIDGNVGIDVPITQQLLIKGDQRCPSIAAASIIAKVTRDRMMVALETTYPDFTFAQHKGYGTRRHLEELAQAGATPIHRRSFAPVRAILTPPW
jgi:ribonuclease HII